MCARRHCLFVLEQFKKKDFDEIVQTYEIVLEQSLFTLCSYFKIVVQFVELVNM